MSEIVKSLGHRTGALGLLLIFEQTHLTDASFSALPFRYYFYLWILFPFSIPQKLCSVKEQLISPTEYSNTLGPERGCGVILHCWEWMDMQWPLNMLKESQYLHTVREHGNAQGQCLPMTRLLAPSSAHPLCNVLFQLNLFPS